MSSLRLALKQSLQEASATTGDGKKSKKKKKDKLLRGQQEQQQHHHHHHQQGGGSGSIKKKKKRRGRPPRSRQMLDEDDHESGEDDDESSSDENEMVNFDDDESSSEEEGEMDEEEDDDDQDRRGDRRRHEEKGVKGHRQEVDRRDREGEQGNANKRQHHHHQQHNQGQHDDQHHHHRAAKKQHSAAETIQNTWKDKNEKKKKKKHKEFSQSGQQEEVQQKHNKQQQGGSSSTHQHQASSSSPHPHHPPDASTAKSPPNITTATGASTATGTAPAASSSATAEAASGAAPPSSPRASSPKALRKKHQQQQQGESNNKQPSGSSSAAAGGSSSSGKSKTVPPPEPALVSWQRQLSVQDSRKNVGPGLRVKVRFAMSSSQNTNKRRKKWFGGRVSAVSKEGSKIRIKYDDGTQEVTRFPDVDVIVDDSWNGQHEANADMFIPPLGLEDSSHGAEKEDKGAAAAATGTTASKEPPQVAAAKAAPEPITTKLPAQAAPHQKRCSPSSIAAKVAAEKQLSHDPQLHQHLKRQKEAFLQQQQLQKQHQQKKQQQQRHDGDNRHGDDKDTDYKDNSKKAASTSNEPQSAEPAAPQLKQPPPVSASEAAHSSSAVSGNAVEEISPKPKRKRGRPPKHRPLTDAESTEPISPAAAAPTAPADHEEGAASMPPKKKKKKKHHKIMASNEQPPEGPTAFPAEGVSSSEQKQQAPSTVSTASTTETVTKDIRGGNREDVSSDNKLPNSKSSAGANIPPGPSVTSGTDVDVSTAQQKSHPSLKQGDSISAVTSSAQGERRPSNTGKQPSLKIRIKKKEEPPVVGTTASIAVSDPIINAPAASDDITKTTTVSNMKVLPPQNEPSPPAVPDGQGSRVDDHVEPKQKQQHSPEEEEEEKKQPAQAQPVSTAKRLHIHIPKPSLASQKSVEVPDIAAPAPSKTEASTAATITAAASEEPSSQLSEAVDAPGQKKKDVTDTQIQREVPFASAAATGGVRAPRSPRSPQPKKKRKRMEKAAADEAAALTVATVKRLKNDDSVSPVPEKSPRRKVDLGSSKGAVGDISAAPTLPDIAATEGTTSVLDVTPTMMDDGTAKTLTPNQSRATVIASSTKQQDVAASGVVRSGRRAARQANERIAAREEKVIPTDAASKKKKKRRKDGEQVVEENSESSEDDSQWVQCDKCAKWRIIPTIVVAQLPKQWYCADNIWDPKRASCDAPEQTAKQAAKEKKRRKKLQARLAMAAAAEAQAVAEQGEGANEEEKPEKPKPRGEKPRERARSPRPRDETDPQAKPKRASPDVEAKAVESGPPPRSEKKGSSLGKKGRQESVEGLSSMDVPSEVKPRGRGRPRRNAQPKETIGKGPPTGANTNVSGQSQQDQNDNLEWVQCEKCEKWRKLPAHISADELPDVWFCSLNTWNPTSASCDAPEDKADGLQDIGFNSGGGGGKLSYRNLIFGSTGRKANRPISERTRAAESIFLAPNDDEDAPPSVLYANSSAFVSRGRNYLPPEENETISVLELMSHSNLWKELRNASHQWNGSNGDNEKRATNVSCYTFDTLPNDLKQSARDLILHSLGDEALSSDDIVVNAQRSNIENMPKDWSEARLYCTSNVVVTALCELVKEGTVECLQCMGPEWTVKDWNPRYRRTKARPVSVGPLETSPTAPTEAHKASRSLLKIAKPWKRPRM